MKHCVRKSASLSVGSKSTLKLLTQNSKLSKAVQRKLFTFKKKMLALFHVKYVCWIRPRETFCTDYSIRNVPQYFFFTKECST